MYGNYDFKDQLPEFDVYLGPNYWQTIKINSSSKPINREVIHVLSSDYLHVCLINTGHGIPFISAIELRLLADNMYKESADFGSLHAFSRVNFGDAFTTVRYEADKYDRLWLPVDWPDSTRLYTLDKVYTSLSFNDPPEEVMSSAIIPAYPNDPITMSWSPVNPTDQFFIYIHFADIQILKRNQLREFTIYLNGNHWIGPFSPFNHSTITTASTEPETVAPTYILTINKTKNSTLPPIINAIELYTLKQLPQKQTYDQDVFVLWSIKSIYKINTKNWQGDPCTPQEFVWEGIGCSNNDTESPRIVSLNLSSSGLKGDIDPGIANLTMIHTLDLSNNNLTGIVPNFLSRLKFLTVLKQFHQTDSSRALSKGKQGIIVIKF